jgi:hypothetical protein
LDYAAAAKVSRTPLRSREMDSEVATLLYLHRNISLPVPVVISYSTSATHNPLGAGAPPLMLMAVIIGCTLRDLGIDLTTSQVAYDIRQLQILQRFMKQLAAVHLQPSSVAFPAIGSLYNGPDGETCVIGPCSRTGEGPFSMAREFFAS